MKYNTTYPKFWLSSKMRHYSVKSTQVSSDWRESSLAENCNSPSGEKIVNFRIICTHYLRIRETHYVLRVLKTCLWDPRCQTYVFESRITLEIQKWVQNNQFQTPSVMIFSKNCFRSKTKHPMFLIFLLWKQFFLKSLLRGAWNWLFRTHFWTPYVILLSKTYVWHLGSQRHVFSTLRT